MDRRRFLAAAAALPLVVRALPVRAASSLLKVRDLYNKDLSFSPYALERKDKRIAVQGYMAPPLKAQAKFFVLTTRPLAVCPFCETEAEWPDDILVVYTDDIIDVVPFNVPIQVSGTLELGTYTDTEIGFVSRVRITAADYEKL